MIADRWRRELAAACGVASLYFAVQAASVAGFGAWLGCVFAAGLLLAAVTLTPGDC